jgi:hypothetical protein
LGSDVALGLAKSETWLGIGRLARYRIGRCEGESVLGCKRLMLLVFSRAPAEARGHPGAYTDQAWTTYGGYQAVLFITVQFYWPKLTGGIIIPLMAGRRCKTCSHPNRVEIDRRLTADEPVRQIARDYGLNHVSLLKHKKDCAGLKTKTAEERREPTRGTVALALLPSREEMGAHYERLGERIDEIVKAAERTGSLAVAVQGLNTLRQTFDSMSRLAGHTGPNTQVNVGVQVNISAADLAKEIVKLSALQPDIIDAVVFDDD